MLRDIIGILCKNHRKRVWKNAEFLIVMAGGIYFYHWVLKR